jgi:hypothetical protein
MHFVAGGFGTKEKAARNWERACCLMEKSFVFVRACAELAMRVLGAVAAAREVGFAGYAQRAILEAAGRRGMTERGDLPSVEAFGKIGAIGCGSGVGGDEGVGGGRRRGIAAGEESGEQTGEAEGG